MGFFDFKFDLPNFEEIMKKPMSSLLKLGSGGLLSNQIDYLKEKTWNNSSIRDEYMKNQKLINTAAAALAGGALAPGLLSAIPGMGAVAPLSGAQLLGATAGGAALGRAGDKKDAAEEAMKALILQQQTEKDAAGDRVDDILGDIVGDPDSPVTGPITDQPPVSLDPSLTPSDGEGLIDQVIGETPLYGGAVDTGGQASRDQQQLLDEAELQYKMQQEHAEMTKAEKEKMLKEYADLISQQQNRILDENAPALYEDLNTRGLLRSSELGNAMARERAKAAAILGENVGLQGLTDRDAYLSMLTDANSNYLSGRSGSLQRRYSLEDFARQAQVAKDTGIALQPISTGTPSSKAGDAAMVGAGAQVATALKGK